MLASPAHPDADWLPRGARWLVISGAALFVAACIAAGLLLSHLHRQFNADARRELGNLALVLARYTENSFRSVELLEDGLLEMVGSLNIRSGQEFDEQLSTLGVHLDLQARIAALVHVDAAFFANAQGIVVASSRSWPQTAAASIADRPYFEVLRDNPGRRRYLAPPTPGVRSGIRNIYLTRRIDTADGRFLGVVGAALSLSELEAFLSRIALGAGSAICVWRRDGVLMARHPPADAIIGGPPPGNLGFQNILQRGESGIYRARSAVDGEDRIVAARALTDYPVAVTVSRRGDDVLALWRREAGYTAAALLALAIAIPGVVLLGIRALRSRDLLEQARTEVRVLEEQRRSQAQIAHLAHHDPLTGLANRLLLRTRLDEAVARARRGQACAVLCLDLDHFKDVNDTLGHAFGDMLLRAVTERIRTVVRETDTIARLGGDEFAVVQTGVDHPDDAGVLAQRLIAALGVPFDLDGNHVMAGVSIGIAVAPDDGLDSNQLLQDADMALYRAKSAGRGCYRFFEAEMNAQALLRRTLQVDIRRGLQAGEFELFYQPQVSLPARRLTGFEALLRWRHPERGLLTPDRFVPLAEDMGLILPLGEWVLTQACAEAAAWPADKKLAVNLSPVQFTGSLVETVTTALHAAGLDAARLELEVTETVLLRETEATLVTLHRLRGLGVAIALDDFGTGYSSLGYLQRFPFDKVKIDRTFIRSLGKSRESDAIVRSVIDLCDALDMVTIAEGVETEEQRRILTAQGCDEAQGHLFGRPMTVPEIRDLLRVQIAPLPAPPRASA
ncbi:EAL domain-containing protein [Roseomonas hellenica]|uniref:EAL domain-containing protein n=1 Tax=Plastoroseomonas hellenica TaxID=2687306 RepID=A0ABS5ER74_9PROT|nr:EAL domain-containing protein [Plastoroseomonas hellenica]MBR0662779.1 EAL domain-containing protein [Plastoroseomonas hellenica]